MSLESRGAEMSLRVPTRQNDEDRASAALRAPQPGAQDSQRDWRAFNADTLRVQADVWNRRYRCAVEEAAASS